MRNHTNSPKHNQTKQATFRATHKKSVVPAPRLCSRPQPRNPLTRHFSLPRTPAPVGPGGEGMGETVCELAFSSPTRAQSPPKRNPSHPRLSLRPQLPLRAPPAAPHSRVDDGHEMHQPQHQEEDEPEDGHSLQGQVQQRHPPARPAPAAATDSAPAGGQGRRPARGRRRGEEGGERKGRSGVGTEGAGRACAPPPARSPGRARDCRRCGGRAGWSGRPWLRVRARLSTPSRPPAGL